MASATIADDDQQQLVISGNDKIPIRHLIKKADGTVEEITTQFVGLETALREFNEETVNEMVDCVLNLSNAGGEKAVDDAKFLRYWRKHKALLKQDYGFHIEQGYVIFQISHAAEHRKNERLMAVLRRYVEYVIALKVEQRLTTTRTIAGGRKTSRNINKGKEFKKLEQRAGISEHDVMDDASVEENIDNLLIRIGNLFGANKIKM